MPNSLLFGIFLYSGRRKQLHLQGELKGLLGKRHLGKYLFSLVDIFFLCSNQSIPHDVFFGQNFVGKPRKTTNFLNWCKFEIYVFFKWKKMSSFLLAELSYSSSAMVSGMSGLDFLINRIIISRQDIIRKLNSPKEREKIF